MVSGGFTPLQVCHLPPLQVHPKKCNKFAPTSTCLAQNLLTWWHYVFLSNHSHNLIHMQFSFPKSNASP